MIQSINKWSGKQEEDAQCLDLPQSNSFHAFKRQKLLQYCKVISLQLIKINEKKYPFYFKNSVHFFFRTTTYHICKYSPKIVFKKKKEKLINNFKLSNIDSHPKCFSTAQIYAHAQVYWESRGALVNQQFLQITLCLWMLRTKAMEGLEFPPISVDPC